MNSASTSPNSDSKHHSDANSVTTTITTMAHLLSTPATNTSGDQTKEFMKLTPVHLQCLTSPSRRGGARSGGRSGADIHCLKSHELRTEDTYRENFNMISRQLEKLLENLNVIYRQIGYSNTEIIGKEKLIFNTLSRSITSFFDHAENDMKMLNVENETGQELLNRMLEIMRDSNGLDTIPDIYVRNAILTPGCKTVFQSPKKPVSLLSKRKLLRTARGYVFKAFVPALIEYLEGSIQLRTLVGAISETLTNLPNGGLVNNIPSLDSLKFYRDTLTSHQNDLDYISNFFVEHRRELLYSDHFSDVSTERAELVHQIAQIYEAEYTSRLLEMNSVANKISKLVSELRADLDPQVKESVALYLRFDPQNLPEKYVTIHRSTMESFRKILQEYQMIYQKRKETKDALLTKCESLWAKLKMPQAYIHTFMAQISGLSITVTQRISKEVEKLEDMKKKLIKTLIDESLQRIEELWTVLQYTPEERSNFLHLFYSLRDSSCTLEDDERLLETCEREIRNLETKWNVYKPVLELLEEFNSLQSDKLFLEESSRDSSRLLARNSHKILLQEEKTRKRITRHFPRVIKELKSGLEKLEKTFGKPLMLKGHNMIETVSHIEEELISKYPKSRLNLGRQKMKDNRSGTKTNKEGKVTKKSLPGKLKKKNASAAMTPPIATSMKAAFSESNKNACAISQTPITKIIRNYDNSSFKRNTKQDSSQGKKYVRGTKTESPTLPLSSLLSPNLVTKEIISRIPEPPRIQRTQSLNITSSPIFEPKRPDGKLDLIRPRTLFQVSPNKMNQKRSQIPTLSKTSSLLTNEFMNSLHKDKENLVDSTPRLSQKGKLLTFNSPYREPENSVYKISKSPDGKCILKVEQNSHLESGFDDTSFMDEENEQDFNLWKNEQLARIKTKQINHNKLHDIL